MRLKPTRQHFEQVVQLHRQGMSIRDIASKTGVSKSAIHRWLSIFAQEDLPTMKTKPTPPKRATGVIAPENVSTDENSPGNSISETAEERIARLEKELEESKLRADLYYEIIHVAEQKFDIQIIKKAGTKR